MTPAPRILVFDSGLGGLTVYREIAAARPDAQLLYVADDAFFPYGAHGEAALVARIVPLMGELIAAHCPDLIVVACNTASVQALAALRAQYRTPFVGTVPAIKPACAQSTSKRVAVLGTKATVAREYTRGLIHQFAQGCAVDLVGSATLAGLAEAELGGSPAGDADIAAEIAPCFIDSDGKRTDTVVLACTHFPLLLARLTRLAPWPVAWIDPAPAIARRVAGLAGAVAGAASGKVANGKPAPIVFTSGKTPAAALARALAGFSLAAAVAAQA